MKLIKEINTVKQTEFLFNKVKTLEIEEYFKYNPCLHPKWIKRKSDNKYIAIRCEECFRCRLNKVYQWNDRLINEIESDDTKQFVTMYINEKSIEELKKVANKKKIEPTQYKLFNQIATIAIRRYLEIWRKKTGTSVKHWFTTELTNSETNKIKIHGIIFSKDRKQIITSWKYGNVMFADYINIKSIIKLLKYLCNTNPKTKYYKPIVLCSPKIGINKYKKAS
jgi:hypothetical protein